MKKILVCFVGLALTACSANSLNYGAEQVRVMTSEPGKECSYLGDITGSQGNFFTGGWTSNSNLETGARNDLKNKAYKMGGPVNPACRPDRKFMARFGLKQTNQCHVKRERLSLPSLTLFCRQYMPV